MGTVRPTGVYMFKWTDKDGICHGGDRPFKYSLPVGNVPGKWHTKKEPDRVHTCEYGFHCVAFDNIHAYKIYGPRLFLVEVSGAFDNQADKAACQSIRFIRELKVKYNRSANLYYFTDKLSVGYVRELLPHNSGKLGVDFIGKV